MQKIFKTDDELSFVSDIGGNRIYFVDDGSSDHSVSIIEEYMQMHPDKISLYHTDHTGPGGARNKGIECARADYIGFADADDYMEYNMYEKCCTQQKTEIMILSVRHIIWSEMIRKEFMEGSISR